MELNLKLFVHGVPYGQKSWGPQGCDRIYIERFYGRKAKEEVQLVIDVFQVGNDKNCYYTYLRNGNIIDSSGRGGGYFALTVKVNAYYASIYNMYNILDAVYHKLVLGTILEVDASATKFIVQDFDRISNQLQAMEDNIVNYISQFSVESDFVDLNGFIANAESEVARVNLLDCNDKKMLIHIKSRGNVSVSPLFPTIIFTELLQKKNAEIRKIEEQTQQQVIEEQKEAVRKVEVVQKEKEDAISTIRTKYASADKTISELENRLDAMSTLEKELIECRQSLEKLSGLKSDYDSTLEKMKEKEKELANAEQRVEELDKLERDNKSEIEKLGLEAKELEAVRQTLLSVEQPLSDLNEIVKKLNVNDNPEKVKNLVWLHAFNAVHPWVNLVVIMLLILLMVCTLPKSCSSASSSINELNEAKEQIERLNLDMGEAQKQLKKLCAKDAQTSVAVVRNSQQTNSEMYPEAKIDIQEFSKTKQSMGLDEICHISIINVDTKGEWQSNDFIITNNAIKPKRIGGCRIDYVVDGSVVKSRTINVIE